MTAKDFKDFIRKRVCHGHVQLWSALEWEGLRRDGTVYGRQCNEALKGERLFSSQTIRGDLESWLLIVMGTAGRYQQSLDPLVPFGV